MAAADLIGSALTVVGSGLGGGLLRMVPEFIKHFDRKNERAHEALMFDKEITLAKERGNQEMRRIDANERITELDAIKSAFRQQAESDKAAGGWVAKLSSAVRPVITFWYFWLYSLIKLASLTLSLWLAVDQAQGAGALAVLTASVAAVVAVWTLEDSAAMSMILSFWFVGRAYERDRKGR